MHTKQLGSSWTASLFLLACTIKASSFEYMAPVQLVAAAAPTPISNLALRFVCFFSRLQVDWRAVQAHRDTWLALARKAFSNLDRDQDGVLRAEEIMKHLEATLPDEGELRRAVQQALEEAGQPGDQQVCKL